VDALKPIHELNAIACATDVNLSLASWWLFFWGKQTQPVGSHQHCGLGALLLQPALACDQQEQEQEHVAVCGNFMAAINECGGVLA
jgi:hypothetical protein